MEYKIDELEKAVLAAEQTNKEKEILEKAAKLGIDTKKYEVQPKVKEDKDLNPKPDVKSEKEKEDGKSSSKLESNEAIGSAIAKAFSDAMKEIKTQKEEPAEKVEVPL